ncbi:hypothetical protein BO94DRAFT_531019 [Aspergillus sclerotioniger CBS 115572]|uniref:PPP4R2-domain-containing protein n=1 Tax=Aspergillus sclerotioniger CBS 115572 TaxID=1450535 RepID=A0A317XDW4_9EURO|nr:hypothetical protein BO94DRAFT_531019 [Aspergillus sclerotioniger CBS 115572]PWY95118.1 hypothetical protein BO94DRAFT_531019 [Aspergillus sclerotioniger CBS 115572]
MSLDEETLEVVANGGSMDYEKWPSMVEPLLDRLDHIIYNVFPMPRVPPEIQQSLNTTVPYAQNPNTTASSTTLQTPPRPTATSLHQTPASERIPDSQPQSSQGPSLPQPLEFHLASIKSTLRSLFATKPPHTIQRLAELIVRPTAHYRTLPAYIRAVDRVVCVTSGADIFPLQTQTSAAPQPNGAVLNGTESGLLFSDHGLGSDESLGGALLTPIPWLSNAAASPEREDESGAVMGDTSFPAQAAEGTGPDQTGTGVVPSTAETVETNGNEGVGGSPPPDALEDIPHARGPSVLGVEDLGLQDGKGVEMDLSSAEDGASELHTAGQQGQQQQTGLTQGDSQMSEEAAKLSTDGDGDIALEDAKAGGEETPGSETANKEQQQA